MLSSQSHRQFGQICGDISSSHKAVVTSTRQDRMSRLFICSSVVSWITQRSLHSNCHLAYAHTIVLIRVTLQKTLGTTGRRKEG